MNVPLMRKLTYVHFIINPADLKDPVFMNSGPDVSQPQPQLISTSCNTPLEETKQKIIGSVWLGGQRVRDSEWEARVRDAIQGARSLASEPAQGEIRRGGWAVVEPGSQRRGWGYSLPCRESLRRLPRAWLAVIPRERTGRAVGGPLSPPLFPSICLDLTMAHRDRGLEGCSLQERGTDLMESGVPGRVKPRKGGEKR